MEEFIKAIGAVIVMAIIVFVLTLPAAGMWYTFDDQLAAITGVPALGTIPFWNVYGFTWFIAWMMFSRSVKSEVKK